MAIYIDPVIGNSPLRIGVEPSLRAQLGQLARGRPLVIDYYASRYRGIAVGDVTVSFPSRQLEPCYIELEPIDEVRVLAHRCLMDLLRDGATLRLTGAWFLRHMAIVLTRPERWIEFLERSGSRRR